MSNKKLSASAMNKLQKAFGKENIANLNEGADISIERIPSGSLALDRILGGGWPKGRIIEFYGPPSSGKSSLAAVALKEAQKAGLIAGFVDMEASYDPDYAEALGVDNDTLVYSAPDTGEEALNIVESLAQTGEVGLVVLDSSNACSPKAELEGEMEDQAMALQARLFSKAMRKLVQACKKSGTILIIISQIRQKIGQVFGDPRAIGVGNAIFFADSIRLEILANAPLEDEYGESYGHLMRFKTVKNKTFRPKLRTEAFFRYDGGFCPYEEVCQLGVALGIINKSGSWYSYGDTKLGQGSAAVVSILEDNPELFEELKGLIVEGLK